MIKKKSNSKLNIVIVLLAVLYLFSCKTNQHTNEKVEKPQKNTDKRVEKHDENLPLITVVGGQTKNMGQVKEGIKASVVFTLKNTGNTKATDISVHDLSKGGCTAVSKVSELAPGDSANLIFIFETLGYGGKKQKRQIRVRYNNPELSPITLTVLGEVLPTEEYQVPIGELFYNFFVLVDIRDKKEFEKGHIIGAINVPSNELEKWVTQLPESFLIYLYSDTGVQSDKYAKILREKSFSRALSIVGGLEEWKGQYGDRHIITGDK